MLGCRTSARGALTNVRSRTILLALTALAAMLVIAPSAFALQRAGVKAGKTKLADHGLPGFDSRGAAAARDGAASPAQVAAAAKLQQSIGSGGVVDISGVTSTPRYVANLRGFLSASSRAAPQDIALGYVRNHLGAFGLTAGDVAGLRFKKDYVDIGGTHHLTWTQSYKGIAAFDSFLRAAVTKDGRLVQLVGSPLSTAGLRSVTPKISAQTALGAALRNNGGSGLPLSMSARGNDAAQSTSFVGGHSAKLVLFAVPGGVKLGWLVNAKASSVGDYYDVVDADSGSVLWRSNMVSFASGDVWEYYPSNLLAAGVGTQTTVTFPAAWGPTDTSALSGDFAHVYTDVNDLGTPDAGAEIAANSGSAWSYAFSPYDNGAGTNCDFLGNQVQWKKFKCSWNSAVANSWMGNIAQNATQVFYYVNKFHDHLLAAPIGFTEAAGNFQNTNASGQGVGGDAVQAQTDVGANTSVGTPDSNHYNKSNMTTSADGSPPRMQMYLFKGGTLPDHVSGVATNPDSNGGDDASIVYHEYTHGLSHRLVTYGSGMPALNSYQSQALGEGWSDWYAMDYLVKQGYAADTATVGDVSFGFFSAGGALHALRTDPMDCPVDTVTLNDCTGGHTTHVGGYTYGDTGRVCFCGGVKGAYVPEVHADGEIWAQTLWQIRQSLGSDVAESLITRGMELTAPNPSFLDARDGIIQADQADPVYAGSHVTALWSIFAERGMGINAATSGDTGTAPGTITPDTSVPGTGTADLHGTITDSLTGSPVSGVVVQVGGFSAATSGSGAYTVSGVTDAHTYTLRVAKAGYDLVTSSQLISGSTLRNFSLVRDWASLDGGAAVQSFTLPDYTTSGCGPTGAMDQSLATGWGSDTGANRALVIRLPGYVNVGATGIQIDPANSCGDPAAAALAQYTLETSTNNTTWNLVANGTFAVGNNGHLNAVAVPAAARTGVRYVRLTMKTSQGGGAFMDTSELEVYGVPGLAPPPAPTIGSFTPTSGPVGTSVTINGTNLTGASGVQFHGTPAVTFSVVGPTQVTATVPAGATTGTVAVTTPGGMGTSAGSFTVIQPPTVSSFSPASGPVGTSVTINGTNLTAASAVKFHGTSAVSYVVNSAIKITATVPAGATTGTIAVTTAGGTATSAGTFTVIPAPTVGSFSPASGPVGTSVTINGTNLTGASAVKFHGTSAVSYVVNSAIKITATVPSGATTGTIAVTTAGGTATSAGTFTVIPAPTPTAASSPTSGPVGTSVTINGTNLTGASAVKFHGTSAVSYVVNSAIKITATVPSGATTGTIAVTTPGGTATSVGTFTVAGPPPPLPTITSFSPGSGRTRTVVTIHGTNLASATAVKLGPTLASSLPMAIITKTATQITAWVWDYNTYYPSGQDLRHDARWDGDERRDVHDHVRDLQRGAADGAGGHACDDLRCRVQPDGDSEVQRCRGDRVLAVGFDADRGAGAELGGVDREGLGHEHDRSARHGHQLVDVHQDLSPNARASEGAGPRRPLSLSIRPDPVLRMLSHSVRFHELEHT